LRPRLATPIHFGFSLSEISTMVLKVWALVLTNLKTKQECWSIEVVVGWQRNAFFKLLCNIMHINFSQISFFEATNYYLVLDFGAMHIQRKLSKISSR